MGVFVALLFDYKFGNCQIPKSQEQSVKKRLSVFSDSLIPPHASGFSTLPHTRFRGFPTRGHSTSARRGLSWLYDRAERVCGVRFAIDFKSRCKYSDLFLIHVHIRKKNNH